MQLQFERLIITTNTLQKCMKIKKFHNFSNKKIRYNTNSINKNKKMKKLLLILAVVVLLGSLLSGCGLSREICPAYTQTDIEIPSPDTDIDPS